MRRSQSHQGECKYIPGTGNSMGEGSEARQGCREMLLIILTLWVKTLKAQTLSKVTIAGRLI